MARTGIPAGEDRPLFWFRHGLAPKHEVRRSVKNAVKLVKEVLE